MPQGFRKNQPSGEFQAGTAVCAKALWCGRQVHGLSWDRVKDDVAGGLAVMVRG